MSSSASKPSQKPVVQPQIPVQELSIQWLSFGRIQEYIGIDKEARLAMTLEKLIEGIINFYNKIKEEKGDKTQGLLIKNSLQFHFENP